MSSRSDASVPRLLAEIVASYSPKAVGVSQDKICGAGFVLWGSR